MPPPYSIHTFVHVHCTLIKTALLKDLELDAVNGCQLTLNLINFDLQTLKTFSVLPIHVMWQVLVTSLH